jgi:hypothetical protein
MRHLGKKSGSVIVVVLVFAVSTGLVLTAVSKLAMTEKRMNERARVIIEAKEAAEAAVETGFAELVRRFEVQTSFSINALSPTAGNPLVLTKDYYDLFEGTGGASVIRLGNYPYDATKAWNSQDTELIGGQIPEAVSKFIDGDVPGNDFDSLQDKWVFVREVRVLGKATAESNRGGFSHTAYVSQNLQVRDAPLFAHAIFYNMDMEIAPGPKMEIRGAVHANGRMYIQSNSGLDFYKNVSSTGRMYHGRSPLSGQNNSSGSVRFADGLGSLLSMNVGGTWLDSRHSNFRSIASNRWNGNLQTYEHGIQYHNPVAIQPYQADDPSTTAVNDALNFAYQLIMPLTNTKDDDYDVEIEKQKFSRKAGLVVRLTDPDDGDIEGHVYRYDKDGEIDFYNNGTPKTHHLLKMDPALFKVSKYETESGEDEVLGGLYDKRMQQGINLIVVDIGLLKEKVEDNDVNDWSQGGGKNADPESWWNGVVYIEVPTQADPDRADGVIPAIPNWAVKLVNAKEIPNPDFAWDDENYGMTIATNVPMYVHGHFNADGNSSTGSATSPDVYDVEKEPPAALIADAITILSENWEDKDSMKKLKYRAKPDFTEVSAAILTGLVPSGKHGKYYSGGVENFPRFLQNWGGRTFRYRGSMVSLFESEVADQRWGKKDVYSAPNRDWGFNSLFGEGYYPPGTPNTRTYRRVNYHHLTAAEYASAIKELEAAFEK